MKMKKIWRFFLLLTVLFIVGCSDQQVVTLDGKSESWESRIVYEIGKHEQMGKGTFSYLESEPLNKVAYEVNHSEIFTESLSGERNSVSKGDKAFDLTINLPGDNIDRLLNEIENLTLTITWENLAGENFEEIIEFTVIG